MGIFWERMPKEGTIFGDEVRVQAAVCKGNGPVRAGRALALILPWCCPRSLVRA